MTQQSGNSFSAFKTSHDLKIIESSVPIQSCQTACSDLDPGLLSGPAGSRSFSQHRGEQWLLRGRRLPPRPPAPRRHRTAGLGSALPCGWVNNRKLRTLEFWLLLSLKSTLHLEAAGRSGLSCKLPCSCVLIVKNNKKRMAGQPACEL